MDPFNENNYYQPIITGDLSFFQRSYGPWWEMSPSFRAPIDKSRRKLNSEDFVGRKYNFVVDEEQHNQHIFFMMG